MSKLIVNAFKMVNVNHQATQFGVMFLTFGKRRFELHIKSAAIEASCEWISRCKSLQRIILPQDFRLCDFKVCDSSHQVAFVCVSFSFAPSSLPFVYQPVCSIHPVALPPHVQDPIFDRVRWQAATLQYR